MALTSRRHGRRHKINIVLYLLSLIAEDRPGDASHFTYYNNIPTMMVNDAHTKLKQKSNRFPESHDIIVLNTFNKRYRLACERTV